MYGGNLNLVDGFDLFERHSTVVVLHSRYMFVLNLILKFDGVVGTTTTTTYTLRSSCNNAM